MLPSRELVVMGGVAASRVGLWGFDLCERQALQTAAAAASEWDGGGGSGHGSGGGSGSGGGGVVGGGRRLVALFATEKALAELAGLAMLALSLALPAVESFGVLAALSLLAVSCAAALVSRSRAEPQTAASVRSARGGARDDASGRARCSKSAVAASSPPCHNASPRSSEEASTPMLTARGALLCFHALFAPVAAVSLGACAQSAPGAVGAIVCALLAVWHLGVVAIAIVWDDAQLWALWRFASVLSAFQVLPDA